MVTTFVSATFSAWSPPKTPQKKTYKFAYIVAQSGSEEFAALMEPAKKGWNVKGPLSRPNPKHRR
jgi:hypothetical protein